MRGLRCQFRLLLAALVGVLSFTTPSFAQDAVATWLDDAGLQRLLARRFEQELETTTNQTTRTALAQSLAETYAALLESNLAAADRDALEARARAVLNKIDKQSGDPLRLSLLRSSYAIASRDCERSRLALPVEESREELQLRMADIARELSVVGDRLSRSELALERRINRSRGMQAQLLGSRSDGIGMRIAQATYLEAWSRAYLAWMSGDRTEALEAQKLFGMILATGEAFPAPADISVDLRSNEIYAESILGMAFAKSITDSPATVRTWLDLLEAADTAEYVGESLPYWRIALLVRSEAYGEVLTLLQRLPEDAPVSWLRLAAVSGLGARSGTAAARALGTEAIAMLAARGELAQVVDLAEQFNLTDMERDGFALHYVSGVCRYEDARAANDAGDRSTALRIYRVALDDLDAALAEPDAESFPDAVPGAIAMRAWCLHELGRFEEASVLFQEAAERHAGMDAGNYLWMALVSLDSVEVPTVGGEPIDELRARLITRFLNDHPAHPNAPNALLRRFAGIANPTLEDAEMLVMVPTSTSNGAKAHQQGVQMLYRIFRRGAGAERGEAARRFLELVPVPRFTPDTPTLDLQLQLLRVRQLLDISLNTEVARTDVARATLDALDRGVDVGLVDVGGKERELDYRRLCLALLEGHPEDALYYFGLLEDDVDDWTGVAARTLYNAAVVVLADEESSVEDSRVQYGVEAVRRTAGFLLGGDPADVDFTDQSKYRIGRSLALAEQRAHASSGDPEVLARAYRLLVALNAARPRDERVLEGLALAAEASGEDDAALAARRTLVSGSAVGSDPWFRRKHDLVTLLARVDPQRARDVLDQHAVLHPDYGPEPWGPRLSALHLKLQAGGGGS